MSIFAPGSGSHAFQVRCGLHHATRKGEPRWPATLCGVRGPRWHVRETAKMAGAASTDFNNAEHMLKTFAGALAERDKRVAQLLVEKRVELATMEGRKFERKVGAKVQARRGGGHRWEAATITKVNAVEEGEEETFSVQYTNQQFEHNKKASFIRDGTAVVHKTDKSTNMSPPP